MTAKKFTGTAKRGAGFRRTSSFLQKRIQSVGSKRGFSVSRLLTHWAEIVGQDVARSAEPVDVKYGRDGIGATLTLLVKGAEAPMIEMQKERIRATVNACYGYNAIQKVRLTQTASVGFGEATSTQKPMPAKPSESSVRAAVAAAATVQDSALREALEALGARIISPDKQ